MFLYIICVQLLASISGTPKISVPMTIVVSGIAKMFVGELVETGMLSFVIFQLIEREDDSMRLLQHFYAFSVVFSRPPV
jgi:hypothetical protein